MILFLVIALVVVVVLVGLAFARKEDEPLEGIYTGLEPPLRRSSVGRVVEVAPMVHVPLGNNAPLVSVSKPTTVYRASLPLPPPVAKKSQYRDSSYSTYSPDPIDVVDTVVDLISVAETFASSDEKEEPSYNPAPSYSEPVYESPSYSESKDYSSMDKSESSNSSDWSGSGGDFGGGGSSSSWDDSSSSSSSSSSDSSSSDSSSDSSSSSSDW